MSFERLSRLFIVGVFALTSSVGFGRESHSMGPERVRQIVRQINFNGLPRALQNLRDLKPNLPKAQQTLVQLSRTRPAEMSAHLGQTLLFLLTVTAIELVQKEVAARYEGKASEKTLLELAGIAAGQLLDSGGLYLSILGAGVADLGLNYPARALSAWLVDAKARPIMHQTLVRSILATGSLIGWEVGATLWAEAAFLLESEEEFERSKSLFGMGMGALRSLTYSSDSKDLKDRTLAKNMARNLVRVALLNQDLRSRWVDNTFRTRIMSGDFAILTAALTAAGVGTMLIPGGGTVAGFILGVGAIVIAINIPEAIKDSITSGFHRIRISVQRGRLQTVGLEIRTALHAPNWGSEELQLQELMSLLTYRQQLRSSVVTIYLERARMVFRHLLREKNPISTEVAQGHLRTIFSEMLQVFDDQNAEIENLTHPLLNKERVRVTSAAMFFSQLALQIDDITATGGEPVSYKALDASVQELIKFVEISYSRGFNEAVLEK